MRITLTAIVILVFLTCSASAVEQHSKHRVSVRQISHQLNQQFPFTLDFNGIKAGFEDPKLVLDVLEQNIEIEVSMFAQSQGAWVKIPCKLKGHLTFDPVDKHLILDNLLFDNSIKTDYYKSVFAESAQLITSIQQTIVNHLPDLTLVDFNLLNTSLTPDATKGLLIQSRHVQLIF
ncbi:hypothetical protein Q4602_15675 [Paraglaciecola chathamensis]|uniref:hypothetical protein n=1 Tax=Paraglaciecola chathamensis TaxID=368405 RepID=UPI00270FEB3E|nr:hypothetical protein [Paraglaciecola chathamensis]MDO6840921.1 hypothetical protein [Paraglaciecola chathamensis]